MILCKPERDFRKTLAIFAVYTLISLSLSLLSSSFPQLQAVFTLIFIIVTAFAIMVLYRYVATQYIYQLTLTELIIVRCIGRQCKVICSYPLEESKLLISKHFFFKDKYDEEYNNFHEKIDCCQNIKPPCYYFITSDDKKIRLLIFEPNEVFVRAMLENISNIKREK